MREEYVYHALVINRQDMTASFRGNKTCYARWIQVKAIHRNSAYSKINRMGYIISLMFEDGSKKHTKFKQGLLKNFKKNHQSNNLQNKTK